MVAIESLKEPLAPAITPQRFREPTELTENT